MSFSLFFETAAFFIFDDIGLNSRSEVLNYNYDTKTKKEDI